MDRPYDVAHFWEPIGGNLAVRKSCQLRDRVSMAIQEWNTTYHRNSTGFAGLVGQHQKIGRHHVQTEYVEAMLKYKIVVVAQRDGWEDHYRLMEALISGALVLTDRMLNLPVGLENGKSVLVYDNVTHMIGLIERFLWQVPKEEREAVAREGRRIALQHHRSWQMMERIVLGEVNSPRFLAEQGVAA